MPSYLVFGGRLDSDVPFPELPDTDDHAGPAWVLRTISALSEAPDALLLGDDRVTNEARVQLLRKPAGGFRLTYDDTGTFDVSPTGRSIRWLPGPRAALEAVRADVLGCVLAVAMHAAGRLCLHAIAVQLRSGAVAFLGPKHHGKSTLAMACLRQGARLLTDDSLPVDLGPPVRAFPGVLGVRLWADALSRWGGPGEVVEVAGGKRVITELPPQAVVAEPQPLRALYLLAPREPGTARSPAERHRVSSVLAAISLVRNAKIGSLLRKSEAPDLLGRATTLAERVPVYVLAVARDLDALGAVAQQVLDWEVEAGAPSDEPEPSTGLR